jgi:phospholipase/lecithinase/hemolysin
MWYDILCTNWGVAYGAARNYAGGDGTTDDVVGRQVPSFRGATNAATALFVVWACRNDIGVYLLLPDDVINTRAVTNANGWSNLWVRMTRNISNSVVRLHQKGARTVIVPDLEEVQRMPFYYRINDSQTVQLREQLQAGNRALANTLAALDASLPNVRLLRLDFSRRWLEFLDQAVSLGFTRVDTGATLDPSLKDKSYTGPGKDYVFWDWAHTTTRTHAVWAQWFEEVATQARTESLRLVVRNNSLALEPSKLKPGRKYTLETSDNLRAWTPKESFMAVEGTNALEIVPAPSGPTVRLFRLAW